VSLMTASQKALADSVDDPVVRMFKARAVARTHSKNALLSYNDNDPNEGETEPDFRVAEDHEERARATQFPVSNSHSSLYKRLC
jgi:hypothetical protein